MKSKLILSAAIAAIFPFAHADLIHFDNMGLHQVESISSDGGGSYGSFYVGQLNFTDITTSQSFATYCVDTAHDIGFGNQWNSVVSLSNTLGDPSLDRAAALVSADFNAANTDDKAAGLQLAIWAAIYNNTPTLDLTGSTFRAQNVSAAVLGYAQGYYGDKNGSGIAKYFAFQTDESGNWSGGQAQMTPVPEPASMATLAIGAVALLRRRRNS